MLVFLALACAPEPSKEDTAPLPPTAATFSRRDDDGLGPVAHAALDRMPDWLRPDLAVALRSVDGDRAEVLAQPLVDLDDPALLDEAGFALAHLSREVLASRNFYPEVVVENARRIYEADPLLDYVELVETGDPEVDADWSTTTRYRVMVDGVVEERTLARELYYGYVVHPRIEDENPWYINAWRACTRSALECATTPDDGTFWRSFLWEEAAATCPEGDVCPVVPEYLAGRDVLWGDPDGNDAVHGVAAMLLASPGEQGRWFNFGAYGERSIQPNRIYALGRGNCGEWADMTTSIARTALVPNVNVAPASWDHTWNAVWVDRWIAYEPVNWWFDHPYASGYTTWATNGDASGFFQTEQYAPATAIVDITVTDPSGAAVDGASVVLWTPYNDGWSYAGELVSDAAGRASFPVGADKEIGYIVSSPLGEFPGGNALDRATTGLAEGEVGSVAVTLEGSVPAARLPAHTTTVDGGSVTLTTSLEAMGRSEGVSFRLGDTATTRGGAPALTTLVLTEDAYAAYVAGEAFDAVEGPVDPFASYVVVVANDAGVSTAAVGRLTITWGAQSHAEDLALPAGTYLAVGVEPVALTP